MAVPPDSPVVILHLSDLHFGWEGTSVSQANRTLALDGLSRCLARLEPEWQPTHLAITGDIGWAGKKKDYQPAKLWIEKLMASCHINPEAVFLCPGNHDSNRPLAQKNVRPDKVEDADRVLEGPNVADHFVKPFEEFIKFCRDSLCLPPYKLAEKENYVCGSREAKGFRVICLNSAWFAQDDKDEGKLWLGLPLIKELTSTGALPNPGDLNEAPATIVLMHHPKECFNDAEIHAQPDRVNTWDFLGRRCHLLLTGHTHGEVRRADRIAEAAWHHTVGSAFAGASHFNSFRLIRLEDNRFSYRAYEFDPRDADQVWSKKLEPEPEPFRRTATPPPDLRPSTADIPHLRLTLELRTLQANDAPSVWLRPESCFVPVVGRDRELQILKEWCESAGRFRWQIVLGEGGMGKTRLAQEFALACQKLDWKAGFLELDKLEKLVNHAGFDSWAPRKSTLVIVDYAAGKVEPLKKFLKRGPEWAKEIVNRPDAPQLRILLLERSVERGQGWFRDLMNLEGVWGQDLASSLAPDLELKPPASKEAGLTENIYQIISSAMTRWSELTEKIAPDFPRPQESVLRRLADNTGGRPLYLQMAALKACSEGQAKYLINWRREDLLAAAVERERTYHKRLIEKESRKPGLLEMVERALALLGLTGPWPGDDPGWLKILTEESTAIGYGQVSAGEVIEGLRTILKSNQETGGNVLNPIRPDALASAFTAQLLNAKPTIRPLTLSKVLDLAGSKAWTILVRMAQDLFGFKQFPVQDWVQPLVDQRPVPELFAWESQLSVQNPALARWGAEVIQSLLANLSGTQKETSNLAGLNNNLGNYFSTLGRRSEALTAANRAVEIYERLAAENPAAFEPGLAGSLSNLGAFYSALGRREEALVVIERAVEIYQRLAAENPAAFEPDLARSLDNLGVHYNALGRRSEALTAANRAVEIYERLAAENPAAFEPVLATSLNNLGAFYSALGRREEALAATKRAVEIYKRLAADNPEAFEPDLAGSLNNLGNHYSERGCREEALVVIERAVEIYERLAAENPAAFEPVLATSLNNLGRDYSELGRREEALVAAKRAVEIYQRLAAENPTAFEPNLAKSLNNLGRDYNALGRREEAMTAINRAVKTWERLAAENPAAFEPELARSYAVIGFIHQGAGRDREAALSFLAGLQRLAPHFLGLPQAFVPLATWLLQNYLAACQAAGLVPDMETLGPIQAKLMEMKSDSTGD